MMHFFLVLAWAMATSATHQDVSPSCLADGQCDEDGSSASPSMLQVDKDKNVITEAVGNEEIVADSSASSHGDWLGVVNTRKVPIGVIMEQYVHLLDPVQQSKAQVALLTVNTSKRGTCDAENSKCTFKLTGAKKVDDITVQAVGDVAEVDVPLMPGVRWYQNTKSGHLYVHCDADFFEKYDEEVLFLVHEEPLGEEGRSGTDMQSEPGKMEDVTHEVRDGGSDTVDKMKLMDESGGGETDVVVEMINTPEADAAVTIKVDVVDANGEHVQKNEKLEFQSQSAQTALPEFPEGIRVIVTTTFELMVILAKKQIPTIMLETDPQTLVKQRKAYMSFVQTSSSCSPSCWEGRWRDLSSDLQEAFGPFLNLINELMDWFRSIPACWRCGAGAAIVAVKAALCAYNPPACLMNHLLGSGLTGGYNLIMDAWTFSLAVYWCIICGDGYDGCPRGSVQWHGFCSR